MTEALSGFTTNSPVSSDACGSSPGGPSEEAGAGLEVKDRRRGGKIWMTSKTSRLLMALQILPPPQVSSEDAIATMATELTPLLQRKLAGVCLSSEPDG